MATKISPTEKEVIDASTVIGITPENATKFFHHFNAQDWLRANGLPITSLTSQLVNWRNNGYKFDKKEEKSFAERMGV